MLNYSITLVRESLLQTWPSITNIGNLVSNCGSHSHNAGQLLVIKVVLDLLQRETDNLFQSGAGIRKYNNLTTKQSMYCKVGQLSQSRAVQRLYMTQIRLWQGVWYLFFIIATQIELLRTCQKLATPATPNPESATTVAEQIKSFQY